MLPQNTDPDDHGRAEIGPVYQLFEVLSAARDGPELETITKKNDRKILSMTEALSPCSNLEETNLAFS